MTPTFALVGAAGYIAPRHMRAIKDTGGKLLAAYDPNDSVGVIDSLFPTASFFTHFELFDEYLAGLRQAGNGVDYIGVCSPNFIHRAHISHALRYGATAICEKPLVLDPADLDQLAMVEKETGQQLNTILQLRLHPSIIALRQKVQSDTSTQKYDVDLGYFTSRGSWYHSSWKGLPQHSGGIASNIGIHFFDMLNYVFGDLEEMVVHHRDENAAAGYLEFSRARVRWVLSIDRAHLPARTPEGQTTYRSITMDGEEIEFSGGFTDLHTASYQGVLNGQGFGLAEARPSVELASRIRTAPVTPNKGEAHPDLGRILAQG
jgi:UDP-N-acetyl-2-amino-2-deoxyglucuronate dehydrogenase